MAHMLTVRAFNEISQYLIDDPNYVIWARSPDYSEQLYVSRGYENLWGRSPQHLYKAPNTFKDTLLMDSKIHCLESLLQRVPGAKKTHANYIIQRPDASIRFIQDCCYFLNDDQGKCVAIAGISKAISEQQWHAEIKEGRVHNSPEIQDYANRIVEGLKLNFVESERQDTKASSLIESGALPHLSPREIQVLFYTMQGRSSKETARELNISYRTVELYIYTLKKKLKCSRKLEIYRKIPMLEIERLMAQIAST